MWIILYIGLHNILIKYRDLRRLKRNFRRGAMYAAVITNEYKQAEQKVRRLF